MQPQTEEIGLKVITTVKISNNFSRESQYISNTFSREALDFHTSFHLCKRSPRHSKDFSEKLRVVLRIYMIHVTHINESCHTDQCVTHIRFMKRMLASFCIWGGYD